MAKDMIGQVSKWLVLIGGLNWGLVGAGKLAGTAAGWNIVNMVLGSVPMLENVIYLLVGLSALWMLKGMFSK